MSASEASAKKHELHMKIVPLYGAVHDGVKSLDRDQLSVDRTDSQLRRLAQLIQVLQEIGDVPQESEVLGDPEPETGEAS